MLRSRDAYSRERLAKLKRRNVMEEAVYRVGLQRAMHVLNFVSMWNTVEVWTGEAASIESVMRYWDMSRATCYREVQRFRELFPEIETVGELCEYMRRQRSNGVAVIGDRDFGVGSYERAPFAFSEKVRAS